MAYAKSPILPLINTKNIEEKFTANKLNNAIHIRVVYIIACVNAVFFIFFNIFKPADKIKYTTQTRMPLKAAAIQEMARNWLKNNEIK